MNFSPDATLLASAGRHNMHLWDHANDLELLRVPKFLATRPDFIHSLVFSPDATRLAIGGASSGSYRSSISVWQIARESGLQLFRGLASPIAHVWFSPDQNRLAALAHNWRLGVWDLPSRRLLRIIEAPLHGTADNVSLAFDPDGARLAFSSGAEVNVWDSASGQHVARWADLPEAGTVQLAFDQNRRLLAVRNERVASSEKWRQWRVRALAYDETSTILARQEDMREFQSYGFAMTPDGKYFAAWSRLGGTVGSWQLHLIETLTGLRMNQHVHEHHGDTVAVMDASGRYLTFPISNDSAEVRTIPDWTLVSEWSATPTIAPDGKTTVGQTSDGVIFTLDHTASAQPKPFAMNEPGPPRAGPIFSPRGDLVAWGNVQGVVSVADWRAILSQLMQQEAQTRGPSHAE